MSMNNQNYHHKKPLMVGCSGGGGHNSAIVAIHKFLKTQFKDTIQFESYTPKVLENKVKNASESAQIKRGVAIMHTPFTGMFIRKVLEISPYPTLPDNPTLETETQLLSNKQKDHIRNYVDMLLDVYYPEGYEYAAIWNILQRNDETEVLKKLIAWQSKSDKDHYKKAYNYFLNTLQEARQNNTPFTEVISTQAMALPALCDAVKTYNQTAEHPIVIHQYMTDLPTKGAVHFFNVLSSLTFEQQKQMKLYVVGLNAQVMQHFFPNQHQFNEICNINAHENPMVRPGFKDPSLDHSNKYHEDIILDLQSEGSFNIASNEQIASIMLGSQASNDTVKYITSLLENRIHKVFVFGGKNSHICKEINKLFISHPEYQDKIIPLGFMNDRQMTPLMTRSNIIITRGGGLSIMEQMAISHNTEQIILFHHANSSSENLTSGISWEDENVNTLIDYLEPKGIYTQKTCPNRAKRHIGEARLISALKNQEPSVNTNALRQHLKEVSLTTLEYYLEWLNKAEYELLKNHFRGFIENNNKEIKYWETCEKLNSLCNACIDYLVNKIQRELKKSPKCFMDNDIRNIETIVQQIESPSSMLLTLIECYQTIQNLKNMISPTLQISAQKKVIHFYNEYQKPEINKILGSVSDSKLQRLLSEIVYQLAKIIPYKGMEMFFNPQQALRKNIEELNITSEDIMDIVA